jgi:hypothetical protein
MFAFEKLCQEKVSKIISSIDNQKILKPSFSIIMSNSDNGNTPLLREDSYMLEDKTTNELIRVQYLYKGDLSVALYAVRIKWLFKGLTLMYDPNSNNEICELITKMSPKLKEAATERYNKCISEQ